MRFFVFLVCLFFLFGCVQEQPVKISELCFQEGKCIQLEKAVTIEEQIKGLSFRENLPENSGLMFPLQEERIPRFWMKDMLFPIDIVWIDSKKEIVGWAQEMSPCTPEKCETVSPLQPVKYVLEVNSGFMEKNFIKVGEKVDFDE
ncbi:MAG: DUF192 domain-containing protein [Candidatus Diapherotrites archaeon]|nr:DUF192 domain-containing protein [Candidatus Diapherotrites archaeon]